MRAGRLGWGWLGVVVALAGCPASEEEGAKAGAASPGQGAAVAASGPAHLEAAGSDAASSGDAGAASGLARGEMPLEAQGAWPSVPPLASPRPAADPASFVGLGLKAGQAEAEVRAALEGINYLMTLPRSGGLPATPQGEAWAYAESAHAENHHLQSLWLRFESKGAQLRLRSVQGNLKPAEVDAVLGGELSLVNDEHRRSAWGSMGPAPTALVPKGLDLEAGPALRLVCPRSEGGEADVAGQLVVGREAWTVPMAEDRWTAPGHLAEAFVSEDRQRLALIERLPFSGLRLPRYFRRAPGAKAFSPVPNFPS